MPRHLANVRDYFDRHRDLLNLLTAAKHLSGLMWECYHLLHEKPPGIDKKLEKYIINMAALVARPTQGNPHHVAPIGRWSQEDMGKFWMLGFLSDIRMLEADQPNARQLVETGMRKYAKNRWPQLNWQRIDPKPLITEELFASPNVSDIELDLMCRKVSPISITKWVTVHFNTQRIGALFGRLYVPRVVSLAGESLQLGWEIIHDWLRPKDQNHGIDLMTINFLLNKLKTHYASNPSYEPGQRTLTEGCPIQFNGVWYQVAYSKLATNWVLTTCYKRNAPGEGEFAIR